VTGARFTPADGTSAGLDLEIGFLADHLEARDFHAQWFTTDWGDPGDPAAIEARRRVFAHG